MQELFLTTEQTIAVIIVIAVGLCFALTRKHEVEIDMPKAEENQSEPDLRYLQIGTYYGG